MQTRKAFTHTRAQLLKEPFYPYLFPNQITVMIKSRTENLPSVQALIQKPTGAREEEEKQQKDTTNTLTTPLFPGFSTYSRSA